MNIINTLIIIAGSFSVLLPIYYYLKNRSSISNKIFVLLSFVTGPCWAISIAMFRESTEVSKAMFWGKVIYVIAFLIGIIFFIFVKKFPQNKKDSFFWNITVWGTGFYILYLILYTDLFITNVVLNNKGNHADLGSGYLIWLVWMMSIFISGAYGIIKRFKTLKDVERNQLKYFIIGILMPAFGVVPTNAILPLFGIYEYIWVAPLFMMLMNIILAYGVTRTKFLSLSYIYSWIVRTFTVGLITYIIFVFVNKIKVLINQDIFSPRSYLLGLTLTILLSPIIIFSVKWTEEHLVNILIKGKYNTLKVRDNFTRQISTEMNMDKMLTILFSKFYKIWGTEQIAFVLFNDRNKKTIYSRYKEVSNFTSDEILDILLYWERYGNYAEPLDFTQLEYLLYHQIGNPTSKKSDSIANILKIMKTHNTSMIFHLKQKSEVDGLLFVGKKRYGDSFALDDTILITTLINNLSIAIDRALLYQEVKELSDNLQQKVDEQTKEIRLKMEHMQDMRQRESDMLDIMGHELRTPLTIIKNATELLELNKSKYLAKNKPIMWDEMTEKQFDHVKRALRKELGIVEMMLSATKLGAGILQVKLGKVDLLSVLNDSKLAFENDAVSKNVELIFDIDNRKTWYIIADSIHMQQIADNLISNAIKYTEEGSVTVKLKDIQKNIILEVIDTGEGMSEEDIKKLGTKFFRANQYINSKESKITTNVVRPGGTGLGLYVTFGLIKAMNCKYEVESKIGKGSVFRVYLNKYER